MLYNLKKDLNSQYTEFSKVVQQTIIEKEPDYLQSDLPHKKLGKLGKFRKFKERNLVNFSSKMNFLDCLCIF